MNLPKLFLSISLVFAVVLAGLGIFEIIQNQRDNQPSVGLIQKPNDVQRSTTSEIFTRLVVSPVVGVSDELQGRVLLEVSQNVGIILALGDNISEEYRIVNLSKAVSEQDALEISEMLVRSGLFSSAEADSSLQLH